MNNVAKCEEIGILSAVRQRLGAESASCNSVDDKINKLSNNDLIAIYCAWYLGSDSWWIEMKNNFDKLEELGIGNDIESFAKQPQ
jgi:hypothetical protein